MFEWYATSSDREISPLIIHLLKVTQKTRLLNEEPDKVMLAKLRVLEKKMGLVLTLVCSPHLHGFDISVDIVPVQSFCMGGHK